jgi:hypothetical protein
MPANAIETAAEARPLFDQVCRWAARLGMRFHSLPIQVRLYVRHPNRPGHLGTMIHQRLWRGRKLLRNRIRGMEIVRGLSTLQFQGLTAHELGHVWLAVHRISLPMVIEEGFCELLAYRFYSDMGTEEGRRHAREIETNPDPQYGGAFRYVRQVLRPGDLEAALRERKVPVTLQRPPDEVVS